MVPREPSESEERWRDTLGTALALMGVRALRAEAYRAREAARRNSEVAKGLEADVTSKALAGDPTTKSRLQALTKAVSEAKEESEQAERALERQRELVSDVVRIAARWKNIPPKVTGEFHDIIIGVAERLGPLEHPREAMRALMLPLGHAKGWRDKSTTQSMPSPS